MTKLNNLALKWTRYFSIYSKCRTSVTGNIVTGTLKFLAHVVSGHISVTPRRHAECIFVIFPTGNIRLLYDTTAVALL